MDEKSKPTTKKFSFGTARFAKTSPAREALSSDTKKLNLSFSFEEAMKLGLALQAALLSLNKYNRSTTAGRRKGLNVVVHFDPGVVTLNETSVET